MLFTLRVHGEGHVLKRTSKVTNSRDLRLSASQRYSTVRHDAADTAQATEKSLSHPQSREVVLSKTLRYKQPDPVRPLQP